jgi:hypothetical protein
MYLHFSKGIWLYEMQLVWSVATEPYPTAGPPLLYLFQKKTEPYPLGL